MRDMSGIKGTAFQALGDVVGACSGADGARLGKVPASLGLRTRSDDVDRVSAFDQCPRFRSVGNQADSWVVDLVRFFGDLLLRRSYDRARRGVCVSGVRRVLGFEVAAEVLHRDLCGGSASHESLWWQSDADAEAVTVAHSVAEVQAVVVAITIAGRGVPEVLSIGFATGEGGTDKQQGKREIFHVHHPLIPVCRGEAHPTAGFTGQADRSYTESHVRPNGMAGARS